MMTTESAVKMLQFILLTVDGDQVDLFTEPSDSVMTSDNKSRIIYGAELAKIPAEQRLLVTVRPYSCITKKYLTLPMVFAVKRDITEVSGNEGPGQVHIYVNMVRET